MKYEGEYFVKHTPSVPFIIISKNSKWNSVYLKTGPNPKRQKRNWKGRITMTNNIFKQYPYWLDSTAWYELIRAKTK